jgi:hypothetical protein
VRVLVQRIHNEDNSIHSPFNNSIRDLDVSAKGAGPHALDIEPDLLDQQPAGGAGGQQLALLQAISVESGKSDQVGLLAIMRDDRQARPVGRFMFRQFHQ